MDETDQKFVDVAHLAQADALVSRHTDILILQGQSRIPITNTAELRLLADTARRQGTHPDNEE